MNLEKIVSGGQTGVDQGALDAALAAGFPCGGWCPPGRLSEAGTIPDIYPVTELTGGGYSRRTIQNILDSDGTAIIHFGEIEGGTEFTLMQCIKKKRPYRLIDGEEVMPARAGISGWNGSLPALAGAAAALVLGYAAGLVWWLSGVDVPYMLMLDYPDPLLLPPALGVVATAGVLVLAAVAWARRWWSPTGRVHYTLVALGLTGFLAVAHHYNFVWSPLA
jgi:hypothetical protein